MVSDRDRRDLFEALNLTLGEGPASTLMELLPPVGWADVARQSDITAVRSEIGQLQGEMRELRGELKGEMAELRAELKGEMADLRTELRGEMADVRGEMAALRARVNSQLPRFLWANVPIMFGVAGLVLAGAKLA